MNTPKPSHLAVGLAILLVLGIGVPNLANQVTRKKYDRTELTLMADGIVLEIYKRRAGSYPGAGYAGLLRGAPEISALVAIEAEANPVHHWALADGWGSDLHYRCSKDGLHYVLASSGADRKFDQSVLDAETLPHRANQDYDEDAVFANGTWVRWIAGWCCNPRYQEETEGRLLNRLSTGGLGSGP